MNVLEIKEAKVDDSGEYTVKATNDGGDVSATVKITVKVKEVVEEKKKKEKKKEEKKEEKKKVEEKVDTELMFIKNHNTMDI